MSTESTSAEKKTVQPDNQYNDILPDNQYNDILPETKAEADVEVEVGSEKVQIGTARPDNQYNDSAPKG